MKVSASEFKAKCLRLMDEVKARGAEIVITKHGKPVAKLVPYREKTSVVFGFMKNSVTIVEDVISPIDETWKADERRGGKLD
jgi:prevent-host-death family protein